MGSELNGTSLTGREHFPQPWERRGLSEAADFASHKGEFEISMADLNFLKKTAFSDAEKFARITLTRNF